METITPSGYLERFGEPEPLEEVFPASWLQPNFSTWIGEEEEATAWEYLAEVRDDLAAAETAGTASQAELDAAYEAMLFAEGSDWFWWYGSDQESGDDEYFDTAFRALARSGLPVTRAGTPPRRRAHHRRGADRRRGTTCRSADGHDRRRTGSSLGPSGGLSDRPVGAPLGFDQETLSLLLDLPSTGGFEIYLGGPSGDKVATTFDGVPLGVRRHLGDPLGWRSSPRLAHLAGSAIPKSAPGCRLPSGRWIEIGVPLDAIGPIESGDVILAKMVDPSAGPRPLATAGADGTPGTRYLGCQRRAQRRGPRR